MSERS
jgi:hypothetical protein